MPTSLFCSPLRWRRGEQKSEVNRSKADVHHKVQVMLLIGMWPDSVCPGSFSMVSVLATCQALVTVVHFGARQPP